MQFEQVSDSILANDSMTAAVDTSHSAARFGMKRATGRGSDLGLWCGLAAVVFVGGVGLSQSFLGLWEIWTDDPLRSIGMLLVPASLILTLRVWRRHGWELKGTWWGMLPVAAAFLMSVLQQKITWSLLAGPIKLNLLPPKLSLYCFACGVVLLFAGARVWRAAWFPLGLLLLAQPVPYLSSRLVDLPLQNLSAHIARSFAAAIGFPPSNHELLRLMFTPQFGMFIAPGCDGLRGAVTLGYMALIIGYLKRVSLPRWLLYVTGAVLLGYSFNLLRLCALVVYYRIAVGHRALEDAAKQADYAIGGCLILVAAILFFWVATRKSNRSDVLAESAPAAQRISGVTRQAVLARIVAFAALAAVFVLPGTRAILDHQKSFAATIRDGDVTSSDLDELMPRELGDFKLSRAWHEEANGRVAIESAVYSTSPSNEAILGVWLAQSQHNLHESWSAQGLDPQLRGERVFPTANGQTVPFDTAFYSDGITDSFAGNAFCTPGSCFPAHRKAGRGIAFAVTPASFNTRGSRAVSIFFKVEVPHGGQPEAAVQEQLAAEAQRFVAGIDFADLSRRFQ